MKRPAAAFAFFLLGGLLTGTLALGQQAGAPSSAAAASAATASAAAGQLRGLLMRMHTAYSQSHWNEYRAESRDLLRFLNGSSDAMLELARAEARNGDARAAMRELSAIADMGVSPPQVAGLADFVALRADSRFRAILRKMAANGTAVGRARRAFIVADAGLLPEDIAYDPAGGAFLLTSVREARIAAVSRDGPISTFARAPDGWPMLAVRIDARRRLLWATEVALTGFRSVPRRDWGRSAILEYDLGSHRLLRRIEGPAGSQLGDMALSPAGDLLVSDSGRGGMYLLSRRDHRLVRLPVNDFVSPQTPAFESAHEVFVADYVRGIALLDLDGNRVEWLPMENKHALQGTDGLYWYRGRLIAVQNGVAPERITTFTVDLRRTVVASERSVDGGKPDLDPTHGVIVGGDFYYIANSGWNELGDDGSVRPGARLTPALVMRARLMQQ